MKSQSQIGESVRVDEGEGENWNLWGSLLDIQ